MRLRVLVRDGMPARVGACASMVDCHFLPGASILSNLICRNIYLQAFVYMRLLFTCKSIY